MRVLPTRTTRSPSASVKASAARTGLAARARPQHTSRGKQRDFTVDLQGGLAKEQSGGIAIVPERRGGTTRDGVRDWTLVGWADEGGPPRWHWWASFVGPPYNRSLPRARLNSRWRRNRR